MSRVARRAKAIGLVLFLLPFVASPPGAQTRPQFDRNAISEDYVLRLVQIATRLRAVGVADAGKIGELFSDHDNAFRHRLREGDGEAEGILWSHFFRNTHVWFGHLRNPSPIVGYYDPFSGYWLLTLWNNADLTPELRASRLVPEEHLRPDGETAEPGPAPSWMADMASGPLIKVLPAHAARATRGFQTRYRLDARETPGFPEITNPADARAAFRNRQAYFFATLLALQADKALSRAYVRTLNAVEQGDPLAIHRLFDGPMGMPVDQVARFPDALRHKLEPAAYLDGKGGGLILSKQIDNSRWILVTGYGETVPRKLTAIGYIDLFSGE